MSATSSYRICVICTGNICRSPMAEVILTRKLAEAGLGDRVVVDSAGTGDWHQGDPADPRTLRALSDEGFDGSAHRAARFEPPLFAERDLIVVADAGHQDEMTRQARAKGIEADIRLLRSFDPAAVAAGTLEVDDPYYGEAADFARCAAEISAACDGLVDHLRAELS